MQTLLPGPLHRLALRCAHAARLAWWRVRRPDLHGCNVIAVNRAGEVLLVQHSYQAPGRWMLPGGGIARGESAEAAAVREMREETACRIARAREIEVEIVPLSGARNHVHLVACTTDDPPMADGREVVRAAFFRRDALPKGIVGAARRRIERWRAAELHNNGS